MRRAGRPDRGTGDDARPSAPARGLRSAVRHSPARQANQGPLVPPAAPGVPVTPAAPANALDQLVLRRYGWRRILGGQQALCREPAKSMMAAHTSPMAEAMGVPGDL